jgi:cysteine desulfurase
MVQAFGKMPVVIPSEVEAATQRTKSVRPGFQSRDAASKLMPRDPSTPPATAGSAQDDGVDLSLVDAASFAAHKFYGPKGAGFLYLRSGLAIQPIMFGGAHENERRPGTENVAAIAGMAAAAEWTMRDRESEQERQTRLRDELWTRISEHVPDAKQNGQNAPRLANTLNVSLLGLDSEMLLIALDLEGVCASSGSACMVGSVVASHVLLAMGLPIERARSAVRFSLGKWTTAGEIERTGDAMRKILHRFETRKSAYAVA